MAQFDQLQSIMHRTDGLYRLCQCFSTFSVKWNPLQQFWLLTELLSVGGLLRTEGPKFEAEGGGGVFKVAASPPPARDLGERCKWGWGHSPDRKYILDLLTA